MQNEQRNEPPILRPHGLYQIRCISSARLHWLQQTTLTTPHWQSCRHDATEPLRAMRAMPFGLPLTITLLSSGCSRMKQPHIILPSMAPRNIQHGHAVPAKAVPAKAVPAKAEVPIPLNGRVKLQAIHRAAALIRSGVVPKDHDAAGRTALPHPSQMGESPSWASLSPLVSPKTSRPPQQSWLHQHVRYDEDLGFCRSQQVVEVQCAKNTTRHTQTADT